jgi:hypothetical protein
MASDRSILEHISELVEEEKQLRAAAGQPEDKQQRMRHLEEQLDQCWDLLRQRRAKREFGQDPEDAQPRDPGTVEGYIG